MESLSQDIQMRAKKRLVDGFAVWDVVCFIPQKHPVAVFMNQAYVKAGVDTSEAFIAEFGMYVFDKARVTAILKEMRPAWAVMNELFRAQQRAKWRLESQVVVERDRECIVCMERAACMRFVPCQHIITCERCAIVTLQERVAKCHVCSVPILETIVQRSRLTMRKLGDAQTASSK